MRYGRIAVLLLSALAALAAEADAPGVYAITNATLHPVSGPEIKGGVVIIRNGLIEAAGAGLALPPDATVIDAGGGHVYPGLIDAYTSAGFPSGSSGRSSGAGSGPASSEERTREKEPSPASVAAELVNLSTADMDARRSSGVTTIVTAPSSGIFTGQSAVINLAPGDARRGW